MSYSYGYGSSSSGLYTNQQPQQYSAGTYASPSSATYGYATSQPARVVQGYPTATFTTGYTATAAAPAAAASTGGYGYFQRASDATTAFAAPKPASYAAPASYGYGTTAAAKQSFVSSNTTSYQKPVTYASTSSSYSSYGSKSSSFDKKSSSTSSALKTVSSTPTHQNAYEKVVYNAATSFLTQQSQQSKPSWQKSYKPQFRLPNQKGGFGANRNGPPKPQQLHYCEVCKISCAGPQTYKTHLEGAKHKKKAASTTSDTTKLPPGTYKCELCDVICTGKDTFIAHVKGSNHTKTVKLHQKLGKPIPEIKIPGEGKKDKPNVVKTTAPKINFVPGAKLTSTGEEQNEEADDDDEEEDVEPVGENFVEEVKSDVGKVIGYKCTLCDCRFNDQIARTHHLKGRRHRLTYKKKVDSSLKVDVKSNARGPGGRRLQGGRKEEIMWKQRQQEQMRWEQELRLREEELRRWEEEEYMRRVGEDRYWTRPDRHRMHELEFYEWERLEKFWEGPKPLFGGPMGPHQPTPDDRLVMSKHQEVYPSEGELGQVQSIVAATEKALKLVSDSLADEDKPKDEAPAKVEAEEKKDEKAKPAVPAASRALKGVMRVGALAKGLLLKGQLNVELVVLCSEKPTYTLLKKVGKLVPEKLKEVTEEKYNMSISVVQCAIIISSTKEPKTTVKVTLTSPVMREDEEKEGEEKKAATKTASEPKDVLDKEKCLQALAALRHAKWFQARANHTTSCVIVIRILRDLCNNNPVFKPLGGWVVELLCEKSLSSAPHPLGPGEAFRRVMEALASGIVLGGGVGILDPCEKEKTDAAASLTLQERELLTAAAQQYVRMQAFRQLHQVLGVEPLKPKPPRFGAGTKRPGGAPAAATDAKVKKTEEAK